MNGGTQESEEDDGQTPDDHLRYGGWMQGKERESSRQQRNCPKSLRDNADASGECVALPVRDGLGNAPNIDIDWVHPHLYRRADRGKDGYHTVSLNDTSNKEVRKGMVHSLRNARGSASIMTLVFCLVMFVCLALVTDIARLYATRVSIQHGLNLALRAATAQLDEYALGDPVNPKVFILPDQARQAFDNILRANLRLDESNNPASGSIADGPVEVVYFRVVNEADLPFSFSYGDYSETVTRPAAVGIVKVPVRLGGFARVAVPNLPEKVDMYVHATVTPEVISKHLEEWQN